MEIITPSPKQKRAHPGGELPWGSPGGTPTSIASLNDSITSVDSPDQLVSRSDYVDSPVAECSDLDASIDKNNALATPLQQHFSSDEETSPEGSGISFEGTLGSISPPIRTPVQSGSHADSVPRSPSSPDSSESPSLGMTRLAGELQRMKEIQNRSSRHLRQLDEFVKASSSREGIQVDESFDSCCGTPGVSTPEGDSAVSFRANISGIDNTSPNEWRASDRHALSPNAPFTPEVEGKTESIRRRLKPSSAAQTNAMAMADSDVTHIQLDNRCSFSRIFCAMLLVVGVVMMCASVYLADGDWRSLFVGKPEEKLEWDDVVDTTIPPSLYLDRF